MGDDLFSQDIVRDFMASRGGKVKNHELVTHFRRFLNDPQRKVANRGKFREYVNTLATVKLDESGEKMLVLKRKFRNSFREPSSSSKKESDIQYERPKKRPPKAFPAPIDESTDDPADDSGAAENIMEQSDSREGSQSPTPAEESQDESRSIEVVAPQDEENIKEEVMEPPILNLGAVTGETSTDDTIEETPEAMSTSDDETPKIKEEKITQEAPKPAPIKTEVEEAVDEPDVVKLPVPEWDKNPIKPAEVKLPPPEWDKAAPPSTPASSGPTPSKEPPMSVKERAKHLNRMQSESDILQDKDKPKKRDKQSRGGNEDDTNSVSSVGTIALDAAGREWMITCSTGDYQAIYKLLNKNKELAKRKDFITGFNALHWAAKHGNADVIKLLCGTGLVDINARSNGGYTALHLACMHGHDQIIELLVQGYSADPSIRDYSGKKPLQYLNHSASQRTKQILQPRRHTSHLTQQPFKRQGSYSSKIQKSDYFGIPSTVRHSWASNASDQEGPSRSPSPSPRIQRKGSIPTPRGDAMKMPPPQQLPPRRRKKRSIRKQPDQPSSDSELPSRAESYPDISNSMPDVSNPRPVSTII